ncbi:hypothetical protein Bca52824_040158 [Brassica carinata]|uniref:Uncharacterized protein n=1 Tax=Brassica carinata TaxID=52824 RepID=A0A8X7UWN6_BRACI|nr:hypothetical protein Bca52824_040158 [Brassica carinata]
MFSILVYKLINKKILVPMYTNIIGCSCLYGYADFKLNWKRVAITSMFGLWFCWYGGLDKFIKLKLRYVPKSTRFVAQSTYILHIMGQATGKNTSQVKEGLKRDFLPAIALEGGAWPLLQIANF